jgi:membrane-bound lytic murein transglycosylase A
MRLDISRAARAKSGGRTCATVSLSPTFDVQTDRVRAQAPGRGAITILVGTVICFTITAALAEGPLKFRDSQFEPIKWSELAGWTTDDHLAAFAAYRTSCQALLKSRRSDERGDVSSALANVCRKATNLRPQDSQVARAFFEQNFQPVRIARLGEAVGLLTGYFEPIVAGSRFPSPEFHVPLYRRPRDLEAAGYKPGSLAFPNKGVRIGRRNEKNELVPYHDRAAIEAGALDGQKLEICWLKSSSDLLAIQIEGSGRVILEDGTPLRVAFDSHNGYAFSSIERVLIDRNIIPRKEISTQAIRDWMATHPDEAAKVRAANRSYVFFRITGLSNEGEPLGAQGVPLTPGRSIAVDRVHQYGTPFFIEADLPIERRKPASPFRRLMIAQDTGSAIVGPARADLYWGAGEEAGRIAGRIHHPGRFVMLLPRELDIAAVAREAPLPAPKPKLATLDVGKQAGSGKMELGSAEGRGKAVSVGIEMPRKPKIAVLDVKHYDKVKANSANAGASANGRQKLSPLPDTRVVAREVGKENGKGANSTNGGAKAASKFIVLPVLKPKSPAIEGEKKVAKNKGETISASSTAIAAGLHKPSSAAKSKTATTEIKKQEGKGKEGAIVGASPTAIAAALHKRTSAAKSKTATTENTSQVGTGRTETVGASSSAIAAGLHRPSLAMKSKTATEIKKPEGNGKAKTVGANSTAIAADDKRKPSAATKSKAAKTEMKKPQGNSKAKAARADEDRRAAAKSPPQAAPARVLDIRSAWQ